MKSNHIKIALDWTPNINHIGFFVAQAQGFYKEEGLEVAIENPAADNYELTPAKKVELGLVDMALCPTESLLSYRTKASPFPLKAVAAILQEDVSAIVVKRDSGIASPSSLDHKTYASYKARYEDEIVKQMIRNDGGKGVLELEYPDKLGIWDALIAGTYDATWVFLNWEGVQVQERSDDFTYFKMADYKVPYSYSPVIVADENKILARKEAYQAFLKATARGYLYCKEQPEDAVAILASLVPEKDKEIDLKKALQMSLKAFGTGDSWGRMDQGVITTFLEWLYDKGLETKPIDAKAIFTNELL